MRYIFKGSIFKERRRETKFLYIILFSSFIFISFFFSFSRIRVVDLSCNIELGSLYIELHLCVNLSGIWKFFWKPFLFSFDYSFNEFV